MTGWFAPGSTLWLLSHEARLAWRGFCSVKRPWVPVLVTLVFFALMVAGGWALVGDMHSDDLALTADAALTAAIGLLFVTFFMLSVSLSMILAVFYERGDFDLTLSAPLPPERILFVRALSLALSSGSLYFYLSLPFILPLAVTISPRFLCTFGLIGGLMLCVSAMGLWLTMGLIRWVGIKATRLLGHIVASVFGVAVYFLVQLPSLFPAARVFFHQTGVRLSQEFRPDVWWCLPLKALYGAPLVNAVFFAVAVLFFFCSVQLFGARFIAISAQAAGLSPGERKRAVKVAPRRYVPAWISHSARLVLIRKEWVSIARNPSLLVYVIAQILSFLPMAYIIVRDVNASGRDAASTFFFVLFPSMMTGALMVIFLMAEDAPELIATAPLTRDYIRQAKMAAVFIPVVGVFILPLLFLLCRAPWPGVMAALGMFFACVSTAYVCLWYERPISRKALAQRKPGAGNLVFVLGPMVIGFSFGIVTLLAAKGALWALLAVIVPVAILGIFYTFRRQDV